MNYNENEQFNDNNERNLARSENKGLRKVPLDEQGKAVLNEMNFESTAEKDIKQNKKIFDGLKQAVSDQVYYYGAAAFDAGAAPAVNRGIQSGKDRLANHMKSRLAEISEFIGEESSKHLDHIYENYSTQNEEPNAWAEIEGASSVFDLIERGEEKPYGLGDNTSNTSSSSKSSRSSTSNTSQHLENDNSDMNW
jgi:hypothetical protein